MYWRDVITLEAVTTGSDGEGYSAETVEEATVFADVKSAKRSEFYAAKNVGVDLAITVKLRAADYGGQERLVWNGKRYKVERAYTEAREFYELNCSEFREVSE
ncbi:MAG: phage head closure protein [Oscillospiraceae bacterium]|nr:phage head closure protein [Oscillospiraceae bacterium]